MVPGMRGIHRDKTRKIIMVAMAASSGMPKRFKIPIEPASNPPTPPGRRVMVPATVAMTKATKKMIRELSMPSDRMMAKIVRASRKNTPIRSKPAWINNSIEKTLFPETFSIAESIRAISVLFFIQVGKYSRW